MLNWMWNCMQNSIGQVLKVPFMICHHHGNGQTYLVRFDFKIDLSYVEIKKKKDHFESDPLQNVDQMFT